MSGRFFAKLCRHSFNELENFTTTREAFAIAMKTPMDDVAERHSQMEVDEKPLEILPWLKEDKCKVKTDFLKDIDPRHSIKIRSWGISNQRFRFYMSL